MQLIGFSFKNTQVVDTDIISQELIIFPRYNVNNGATIFPHHIMQQHELHMQHRRCLHVNITQNKNKIMIIITPEASS